MVECADCKIWDLWCEYWEIFTRTKHVCIYTDGIYDLSKIAFSLRVCQMGISFPQSLPIQFCWLLRLFLPLLVCVARISFCDVASMFHLWKLNPAGIALSRPPGGTWGDNASLKSTTNTNSIYSFVLRRD